MMNQRMKLKVSEVGISFGIGKPRIKTPQLVLIDEVHTTEGAHGAQVSYLLREDGSRGQVQFVSGNGAESFFSSTIRFDRVHLSRVEEVSLKWKKKVLNIIDSEDPVGGTVWQSGCLYGNDANAPSLGQVRI